MNSQSTSVRFIEVQRELLNFTFHSENGRLQVIDELVKLDGNFVVKIIRKGLCSLSKVYTDSKTFEDESINLVKLCCSQYSKQIGSENVDQIASPAIIIDWTVELCDELIKPKDNTCPSISIQSNVLLSNYLSTVKYLYETIVLANASDETSSTTLLKTFKNLFEALKPRILLEAFEELLNHTVAIVTTEEKLETSTTSTKNNGLLEKWISLLKFSFVTNWFAVEIAKHDFIVHVSTVMEMKSEIIEKNMDKLTRFLSNLPKDLVDAMTDWIPLVRGLIATLPDTWDIKVYDFIRDVVNKRNRSPDSTKESPEDSTTEKIEGVNEFVFKLKDLGKAEEVKTKVIELGMDLFEEIPDPKEYNLVLCVIIYVAQDMETERIRQYALDLSRTARDCWKKLDCVSMIRRIQKSNSIECKNELFECWLQIVQNSYCTDILLYWMIFELCGNTEIIKRFFTNAAAGRQKACELILRCFIFKGTLDESSINNHIIFLFDVIDETLKSGIDLLSIKVLETLFYESVFEVVLASMAGAIIVGTFESNVNEAALKVLCVAVKEHQLNRPIDILALNIELNKIIRKAKFAAGNGAYMESFIMGLIAISKLPLTLLQMNRLMHTITTILDDGKFTEQEVYNVMAHLFEIPDNLTKLSIDSSALASHFDRLVQPLVVRKVSKMEIYPKKPNLSLTKMLFEKIPKAFADGTSVELFRSIAHAQNVFVAAFIISVEMIKQYVSNVDFEIDIDEVVEEVFISGFGGSIRSLLYAECLTECCVNDKVVEEVFISALGWPIRSLLYAECLTECCVNGFNDKRRIIMFIRKIVDLLKNLSEDDLIKMIDTRLQVPKQLVLTFRDASNQQKAVTGMERVLDVVRKLEPSILSGTFQVIRLPDEDELLSLKQTSFTKVSKDIAELLENDNDRPTKHDQSNVNLDVLVRYVQSIEELSEFLQFDFHMLLKHNSLTPDGVCSALQLYKSPCIIDLVSTLSKGKERLEDDNDYLSTKYIQSNLLTPGKLAYVTLQHLKRLGLRNEDKASRTCCTLLENYKAASKTCTCTPLQDGFEAYFELFVSIMNGSSHFSEIKPWLTLRAHHAIQCKNVIMAACSWKAGNKSREEALRMNDEVYKMLSSFLKHKNNSEASDPALCYKGFTTELELMTLIIKKNEDMEFTDKLFELLQISVHSTAACLDVITSWNKDESVLLVDTIKGLYQDQDSTISPEEVDKEMATSLKILPFAAKAFPNAAKEVGSFLKNINKKCGEDDALDLKRIPLWYQMMIDAGYPSQVIESWCTSLVHSQNLSSRDIDAITYFDPKTIAFLSTEETTNDIVRCLFSKDAPKTWRTDDDELHRENIESFKQCLRLAKILREFKSIGEQLKENSRIVQKIRDGTKELCASCLDKNATCNLYEVQENILEELFVIFFDDERESNKESMAQLRYPKVLLKRLVSVFRRLARYVQRIPTLFGHIKTIVDNIRNNHSENPQEDHQLYQKIKSAIHEEVLNLESNQDAMHTLQASGYNQSTATGEDLWYSLSIQMSAYVNRNEDAPEQTETKLTKVHIVWENQLLESVTTCSEKIPGCYAFNGCYSEKPVICGMCVDNRILTLYKGRTEMENVEVKLFPAGMFVFGFYRNNHPYDTKQVWAAFFKMLLDKRLVPKIFLSNVSPAFEWIKQFVPPETSPPHNTSFLSCCNLIPSSEDHFNYDPDTEIRRLHTTLAKSYMKELIILTSDNSQKLEFRDTKPPIANRNTLIKEQVHKVALYIQEDGRLKEMHPDSHDKILKRLMKFAIRKAVKFSVDGNEPTEESISSNIDMKKLLFEEAQQYSKDAYSTVIFDAMKTVAGGSLQSSQKSYDGCEHVEFLQPHQ